MTVSDSLQGTFERMDESEYARICSLATYPRQDDALASRNGSTDAPLSVSEETFAVIKWQAEHRRLRSELRLHRQDKVLRQYLARLGDLGAPASAVDRDQDASASVPSTKSKSKTSTGASRESLCEIAESAAFSPCMLARVLLEAKYGWSKPTVAGVFKEALAAANNRTIAPAGATRGLSVREYTQVLREVRECVWAVWSTPPHVTLNCSLSPGERLHRPRCALLALGRPRPPQRGRRVRVRAARDAAEPTARV